MTRLATLNFLLLQWFGLRLGRYGLKDEQSPGGPFVQRGWALMVGVVPLTGWWADYRGPVMTFVIRRFS